MSKTIIFAGNKFSTSGNIVKPLLPYLKKNGYEVIFIHINNITDKLQVKTDLGFEQFDMSLTGSRTILDLFNRKKPCLLICLEFASLFIIILIRLAKLQNVRTLYFEHGIFIKGHADKFLVANPKASAKRYAVLSGIYFKLIVISKMSLMRELKTIRSTFFKRDYSGLFDFGLFYAPSGYEAVKEKFALPASRAYFAGYPITSTNNEIELLRKNHDKASDVVLFIHQPLVVDKLTTMSVDDEMEMFYKINDICSQKSLNLIIKLHPRADINLYHSRDKDGLLHFSMDNFSKLLVKTKIMIGQFSTALFNGVILDIPIIVMPYEGLEAFYYSEFISFSFLSESVDQLSGVLDEVLNESAASEKEHVSRGRALCGEINTFENQESEISKIIAIQ